MNIYVGNLSWSMTDQDLNELFSQFGNVSSAKILRERNTGRSKGFGFVEMESEEEARNAISTLHETEVQGRKVIVNESQPRPEGGGGGFRKPYGGGGRGGGGYGGGRGGNYRKSGGYGDGGFNRS